MCFYHVSDGTIPRCDVPFRKFHCPKEEMITILEHLEKEGFVTRTRHDFEYLKITHPGAEYFNSLLLRILWFIFGSVFIPVLVAWITAFSVIR